MILREDGIKLNEDTRQQLIQKSLHSDDYAPDNRAKGKNRFYRRVHSTVANSNKEYNEINMNKLFTEDIFDLKVKVHGETGDYLVTISFKGFLEQLKTLIQEPDQQITLTMVSRALLKCINSNDVYIHCTCKAWKYQHSYWATINGTNAVAGEQTSNGKKIANPNDTKGSGCKHTILVLKNTGWVAKIASVITNYINYFKLHREQQYADIIYPAIYGQEYSGEVQMSLDVDNETDKDTIDKANQDAIDRTRFKAKDKSNIEIDSANSNSRQINFDDLIGEHDYEI